MKYLFFAFMTLSIFLNPGSIKACSINEEITPYKFTDEEKTLPSYDIPSSSRYTTNRCHCDTPDLVYYLSKPHRPSFAIAILCGGSSDKNHIESIIHFHRYFLQELIDLGLGVLTVEQRGVDGKSINPEEFIEYYTRSERLQDHRTLIEHLKSHPPEGWNGKLIFLGVSEGGPIVTRLTQEYADITLATLNWSGAGDWSWADELWVFLQNLIKENHECPHNVLLSDCSVCLHSITSKDQYDRQMRATIENPTSDQYFLNMSYKYHADALLWPNVDYPKITTPFLVVVGAKDTLIESCDAFVKKANQVGVNITYLRIDDMDHYIRKRPEVIQQSFDWLKFQLNAQNELVYE